MRLHKPSKRKTNDPTIALINIVFLMLIFFLLAGTIAPAGDPEIDLITTRDAERSRPPAEPVALTAEGALRYAGEPIDEAALFERLAQTRAAPMPAADGAGDSAEAEGEPLAVMADRALPASDLVAFLRALDEKGYTATIVTQSEGGS